MTLSVDAPPESAEPAWSDRNLVDPHHDPEKARRVEAMFSAIAPKYDLNNRIHSFGRDQAWRRAAVAMAELRGGEQVVDVACGTGDLTLVFADRLERLGGESPAVLGIDFTHAMLPLARGKADGRNAHFLRGDAMCLPLPDASADVISIAFGIRNVVDPAKALVEFYRVLRPGGRLIVLEFTVPTNTLMRLGYDFYCGWLMPRTASLIARDRSGAYRYLPRSVNTFAGQEQMQAAMRTAGFSGVYARSLTFGIAACYRGERPG